MRSTGVPMPTLDPPWPDALKIAVVTSSDARLGWRRFAHEVADAVQPGGHSFPLAEHPPGHNGAGRHRAAFLTAMQIEFVATFASRTSSSPATAHLRRDTATQLTRNASSARASWSSGSIHRYGGAVSLDS